MDAFAAVQLRKKQKAEEAAKKLEEEKLKKLSQLTLSLEDHKKLNKLHGYPDPPTKVFAVSKDKSAGVWWSYDGSVEEIVGWEVIRYRKIRNIGTKSTNKEEEWQFKGETRFEKLNRFQVLVEELSNDWEYRFAVRAVNKKGPSVDSAFSNTIFVETPLPNGWFRFYDVKAKRFYYASIKTNRSSWSRPETDPYFLDDSIYCNFTDLEIKNLKSLFVEDIEHFRHVTPEQFLDILSEVGEISSKKFVLKLFKGYAADPFHVTTWTEFMNIMNHIKTKKLNRLDIKRFNPFRWIWDHITMFRHRQDIKILMGTNKDKLGLWVIEHNPFAGRDFYRHLQTQQCTWSMPDDVRFYLPPKLERKLLTRFTYGDIEEFKQYFSMLDVDNSGDLSEKEIKLLLNLLEIEINDDKLLKLMKTIDINGNGTIEFDEFCWMMLELSGNNMNNNTNNMNRTKGFLPLFSQASEKLYQHDTQIYSDDNFGVKLNFSKISNAMGQLKTKNNSTLKTFANSLFVSKNKLEVSSSLPIENIVPLPNENEVTNVSPSNNIPLNVTTTNDTFDTVSLLSNQSPISGKKYQKPMNSFLKSNKVAVTNIGEEQESVPGPPPDSASPSPDQSLRKRPANRKVSFHSATPLNLKSGESSRISSPKNSPHSSPTLKSSLKKPSVSLKKESSFKSVSSLGDSDDEDDDDDEYEGDEKSKSTGSILNLFRGNSYKEEIKDKHPPYCMCGCRNSFKR